MRRYHGRCAKCGPIAAEKITKRRFTTIAVANTIQIGALAAISGNEASCAEPANTASVMPSACHTVRPDFTIAMPVTMPQAKMPGMVATQALKPARKALLSTVSMDSEAVSGAARVPLNSLFMCCAGRWRPRVGWALFADVARLFRTRPERRNAVPIQRRQFGKRVFYRRIFAPARIR